MLNYNLSGTWKTISYVYANVSGTWKNVSQIYTNVSGTWKKVWTYAWSTGSWSTCTKNCGSGTQTRTVKCVRTDKSGTTRDVEDAYCTKMVGTKPATSQNCNTQACTESIYDSTHYAMNVSWTGSGVGATSCPVTDNYLIYWDDVVTPIAQTPSLEYKTATKNGYKYTVVGTTYKETRVVGVSGCIGYLWEVKRTVDPGTVVYTQTSTTIPTFGNSKTLSNVDTSEQITIEGESTNNTYDGTDYYQFNLTGLTIVSLTSVGDISNVNGNIKIGPHSGTYKIVLKPTATSVTIALTGNGMSTISGTIYYTKKTTS